MNCGEYLRLLEKAEACGGYLFPKSFQREPALAKAGVSVEYIDPRTLKPLDLDMLVTSVRKTRRLLVVEHGHYTNSFGSHVIAEVVQAVPGIKVKKIAFPDVPGPGAEGMMTWLRPDAPKITDAAVQLMRS